MILSGLRKGNPKSTLVYGTNQSDEGSTDNLALRNSYCEGVNFLLVHYDTYKIVSLADENGKDLKKLPWLSPVHVSDVL